MDWITTALILTSAAFMASSEDVASNNSSLPSGRIAGGVETTFKQQPYVVGVLFKAGHDLHHIGAATMLAPRLAVTAAQVTYQLDASDLRVRVNKEWSSHERGSHGRGSNERDDSLFEILKIIEHTCYDPLTQDNDISILKLVDPIRIRSYPKLPHFFLDPAEDTAVAVSGWGVRENLHSEFSRKLRTVVMQVSDFLECSAFYRQFTTPRMFCVSTSDGGKDACQGDLGAPVISVVGNVLEGIAGWSYGCGRHPRVCTKVSRFVHFIKINSG